MVSVLKTEEGKTSVGSNPTLAAKDRLTSLWTETLFWDK